MPQANREEALWLKAFDSAGTDAEREACIVTWQRIRMKRIRSGEPPPRYPDGGESEAEETDDDEPDLREVVAQGADLFAKGADLFERANEFFDRFAPKDTTAKRARARR